MKKHLIINNRKIFYTDEGSGKTIILLHGYLESVKIWKSFAQKLAEKYRIICFDIPGHGISEVLAEKHTMEILAETIAAGLKQLKIDQCFMMGHSMGGYVTLMFHKLYPEMLNGFSLFHSHPFSDTEQIREKRKREIELVKQGRKELIAKANVPNAFADDNLKKFKIKAEEAVKIALQTPETGIISNLYAMMNRPDLSESLANTNIPFLFIVGEKDNYIDFNSVVPKVEMPKNSKLCVLNESGHLGFLEEPKKSLECIFKFIAKI